MKKIFCAVLLISCVAGPLWAQSNTTVSYSMGFGMGDIGSFISKPSFRGITVDYRRLIKPDLAVGLTTGWNVFYEERGYATYTIDNISLSGKQFRYSNHVPILATVTHFFKPDQDINPFVTLGIGTMYSRRNTDMNLYTLEQDAWNFALQPEVGVQFRVADHAAIAVTGKYNYGAQAGNELMSAQSFFTFNVGFAFF